MRPDILIVGGRSVSFSHFGIGNRVVPTLTAQSRPSFQAPPPVFTEVPLARRAPALFIATPPMMETRCGQRSDADGAVPG